MTQRSESSPASRAPSSSSGESPTIRTRAGSSPSFSASRAIDGQLRSVRSPRTSSLPVTTTTARGRLTRRARTGDALLRGHDDHRAPFAFEAARPCRRPRREVQRGGHVQPQLASREPLIRPRSSVPVESGSPARAAACTCRTSARAPRGLTGARASSGCRRAWRRFTPSTFGATRPATRQLRSRVPARRATRRARCRRDATRDGRDAGAGDRRARKGRRIGGVVLVAPAVARVNSSTYNWPSRPRESA